jgi:hypothetical protein
MIRLKFYNWKCKGGSVGLSRAFAIPLDVSHAGRCERPSHNGWLVIVHETREFAGRKTVERRHARPEIVGRFRPEQAAGLGTQTSLQHIGWQAACQIMRDINARVTFKSDNYMRSKIAQCFIADDLNAAGELSQVFVASKRSRVDLVRGCIDTAHHHRGQMRIAEFYFEAGARLFDIANVEPARMGKDRDAFQFARGKAPLIDRVVHGLDHRVGAVAARMQLVFVVF